MTLILSDVLVGPLTKPEGDWVDGVHKVTGSASALVKIRGDTSGVESRVGSGVLGIKETNLFESGGVLKVLTSFNRLDSKFDIYGDEIVFRGFVIQSDLLAFEGDDGGTINYVTNAINLDLYLKLDRVRVPFLPVEVFQAAGRVVGEATMFEVRGTLDNPKVDDEQLKGMRTVLEEVFPFFKQKKNSKKNSKKKLSKK